MTDQAILVTVLGALALLGLVLFFVKLKKNQDEIRELIARRFDGKQIVLRDSLALLVAQESRGYSQRRGNGNLILTDDELFFAMPMPRVVYSIPLKHIGDTERVYRMGGQNRGKRLLKIHYKDDQGRDDALGIHIKEMDRWEAEIRARAGGPNR